MALIALEGMEFFGNHGCFPEERITGNRFLVDFWYDADTETAEKTDQITDTVDYQEVYFLIRKEMKKPGSMIEHIARRMLDAVVEKFPAIRSAKIKVTKVNPAVGGVMNKVSVTLTHNQD
ncbi:MAG: dihydroneopterin aldolase [Bacteroidetes bacterium]|nr:dihydroneopterin aldolase [Bacteroidota bacterium]MBU1720494.1 dihydroneopterin aldolase [Bacteroidota bacterium]